MCKSTFPLKYENVGIPLPSKKLCYDGKEKTHIERPATQNKTLLNPKQSSLGHSGRLVYLAIFPAGLLFLQSTRRRV